MLNPSTADAAQDDPTIRRCIGFARAWGFAGVEIVNLFALRSTDPRALRRSCDPCGSDNDAHVRVAARRAHLMVLAWGMRGSLLGRDREVLELLSRSRTRLLALGWTRSGQPRHPLYLRRDARPRALRSVSRSAS